jgi:hypothetical protein
MQNNKLPSLVLALALLVPASAIAGPITSSPSLWSHTSSSDESLLQLQLAPFWAGNSSDCAQCDVGYMIGAYTDANLEYLHDENGGYTAFRFDDPVLNWSLVGSMTAWTNGVFGRDESGAFTYDSGTDRRSNSWGENYGQYALFRIVGAETTQYFLGVEDILLHETFGDRDYNDYVVTFTLPNPEPVPEPSTMLLLGSAMAAMAARRKLARKTRDQHA